MVSSLKCPIECYRCKSNQFTIKPMGIILTYHGYPITITVDSWFCVKCDKYVSLIESTQDLQEKAKIKYKELFPENT